MKAYRYFVIYNDKTEHGLFYAGFDESRIVEKYGLNSWTEIKPLTVEAYGWLQDPDLCGEFWFTEKGNQMFKEKTFGFILDRLPRQNAKAIYRKTINLDELPGWETLVKYQDEHQIVF